MEIIELLILNFGEPYFENKLLWKNCMEWANYIFVGMSSWSKALSSFSLDPHNFSFFLAGLPTWESLKKWHLSVGLVARHKKYYKGKVVSKWYAPFRENSNTNSSMCNWLLGFSLNEFRNDVTWSRCDQLPNFKTKAHFRRGPGSNLLGTNFGLIWSKLNPWVGL